MPVAFLAWSKEGGLDAGLDGHAGAVAEPSMLLELLDLSGESVPLVGGDAEFEGLAHGLVDSPLHEQGPGLTAGLLVEETLPIPLRRPLGGFAQVGLPEPVGGLLVGRRELDPGPFRQVLERLRVAHLVVFHHEVDGTAGLAAGKAVVEGAVLVGDDVERGLRVLVERTEPDMLPSLRAQFEVFADERDQVGRLDHAVSVLISKAPCQRIRSRSKPHPRRGEAYVVDSNDGPDRRS